MIPTGDYKISKLDHDYIGLGDYLWIEQPGVNLKLINPNPVGDLEYMLVSWRMSGSEMVKFLLTENFMDLRTTVWGKAHLHLTSKVLANISKSVKVFFIVRDPRDVASDIINVDNGLHFRPHEFRSTQYENNLEYLNHNLEIISNLINWYKENFGDHCLFLRYEDFVNDNSITLSKASEFLNLEPENKDSTEKYNSIFFKKVDTRFDCFDQSIMDAHYAMNEGFYKKWDYKK